MKAILRSRLWIYAAVVPICAVLIFPIYWLFNTAISSPDQLRQLPPSFWPDAPRWEVFATVLRERDILRWLGNSTLVALGSVALSMSVSVLAGYSLSRFRVRGAGSLGMFILTAKMLPATLLVIPLFGIFRTFDLIGSLWSVILAHATLIIPFSTWMLKGYFDTIPSELEQAAMVDGCSPIGALLRVVLPVATPGLAATALYGFVLSWSDYAYARTFLTSAQNNWTANLGITTMKGDYSTNWGDISAAAILITLPIVVIYLFMERYLVGGLTAGAEK
jgi:multiple sugar transport system permease protein